MRRTLLASAMLALIWAFPTRADDPPLTAPTDPIPPAIEPPAEPVPAPRPRRPAAPTLPGGSVKPPRTSLPPLDPAGPGPDPVLNPPRFVRNPRAIALEPDDDPPPRDIAKPDPEPTRSAPPRRFRLFGRRPALSTPVRDRKGETPTSSKVVESRSDPAADAALKRQLERRVAEVAGDRVRDVEVLVVDRRVVIRARVVRFWQRRAVRRALESLPELTGYRASVDLED